MKYGLGDSLADYGFSFLEKLHSPIFLVHKNGTIKKINEAGRKLLSIAHMTQRQVEDRIKSLNITELLAGQQSGTCDCQRVDTGKKFIKVISKRLESSDYVLVELLRS
jgi:sensor histidine kinase regulating citrate/malate metabolism